MNPLHVSSSLKAAHRLRAVEAKPIRGPRAELIAAFLLGSLTAVLLAASSKAAETFRLDRPAIVHFTPTEDGRLLLQSGVLDLAGDVAWRATQSIAHPANAPEWALDRHLVNVNAWLATHNLGGMPRPTRCMSGVTSST